MTRAIASPLLGCATPVAVTDTTCELLLREVIFADRLGAADTVAMSIVTHSAHKGRCILQAVQIDIAGQVRPWLAMLATAAKQTARATLDFDLRPHSANKRPRKHARRKSRQPHSGYLIFT